MIPDKGGHSWLDLSKHHSWCVKNRICLQIDRLCVQVLLKSWVREAAEWQSWFKKTPRGLQRGWKEKHREVSVQFETKQKSRAEKTHPWAYALCSFISFPYSWGFAFKI